MEISFYMFLCHISHIITFFLLSFGQWWSMTGTVRSHELMFVAFFYSDKPVEQSEVVMTINFTVEGTTVKIKFGPIQDNFTYRVCLVKESVEYDCYKNLITNQVCCILF